jgi:hypothetical protein
LHWQNDPFWIRVLIETLPLPLKGVTDANREDAGTLTKMATIIVRPQILAAALPQDPAVQRPFFDIIL